jgi:hypothetical protein
MRCVWPQCGRMTHHHQSSIIILKIKNIHPAVQPSSQRQNHTGTCIM